MEQHEGTAQSEVWKVLDASVLLKWVFQDENDADRAIVLRDEYLRGDSVIIVPSFAFYEFVSVLRHSRRGLSQEEINREIHNVFDLQLISIELDEDLAREAVNISFQTGTAVYDAYYVALAGVLGCQLITADYESYRRLRHLSYVVGLRDI